MDYQAFFTSLFLWLKDKRSKNDGIFTWEELSAGFQYNNSRITLVGRTGIWIPRGFEVPVSITTTMENPYHDGPTKDDVLRYHYRGSNSELRDNRLLREAFKRNTPLVYFHAIKTGRYQAVFPVQIISDYPDLLYIEATLDPVYCLKEQPELQAAIINATRGEVFNIRRYITHEVKVRLHQTKFREYVLDAYSRRCTVCRLRHPELLDAAHIIPDAEEAGEPIVPNGLALCKIHHSAFDQNIIGITPDYSLRVRGDVLDKTDGPMLEYGFKALEGQKIVLPKHKEHYPDRDRLTRRFEEFGRVG